MGGWILAAHTTKPRPRPVGLPGRGNLFFIPLVKTILPRPGSYSARVAFAGGAWNDNWYLLKTIIRPELKLRTLNSARLKAGL